MDLSFTKALGCGEDSLYRSCMESELKLDIEVGTLYNSMHKIQIQKAVPAEQYLQIQKGLHRDQNILTV